MLRSVVTFPERFIPGSTQKRGFKREVVVVLVCGLMGVPGMAYVGFFALDAIPREAATLRFQFIGQMIFPIGVVFGLWLVYTLAGHLLARVYHGRGPISRLFRPVAWTMVPIAVWFLIRSIVIVFLFLDVEFPTNPEGLTAAAELSFILSLGLESPIYVATMLLGIPFAAWSGYLLSVAIESAKNVSTANARKIAVVPSGLFALYLLWRGIHWAGVL